MQQEDKKLLENFGKYIKKLRLEKSKSLNAFTFEKGGITSATLSRIENGLVDLKFSTLVKLSIILEIPLSDFLRNFKCDYEIKD